MPDPSPIAWQRASGWTAPLGHGGAQSAAGVRIERCETLRLHTIIVRPAREVDLARALETHVGGDLPSPGRVVSSAGGDIVWSAPGQWLVVRPDAAGDDLGTILAGIAAVTDQSDSRALLRVSGPNARDVLAQGFAVDLHPSVFTAGCTATTNVAHISVQIWRLGGAHTIAVPRSLASSFWSWLTAAAAPYGHEMG